MTKKAKRPAAKPANGKRQPPAPVVRLINLVPIDRITPSPFQPRQVFDEAKIAELAESIKTAGLVHPPIVRPKPGASSTAAASFELVVGERRLRAAKLAGLAMIPVDIRDLTPADARTVIVAENLEREDLNAIEEAEAFQMLIDAGDVAGPTELAKKLGVSQGHVSNRLRLLGLPEKTQAAIISHEIPPTHARTLVPLKNHPKILDAILDTARRERKEFNGGKPLTGYEFDEVIDRVLNATTTPIERPRFSQKLYKNVPKPKLTDEQRDALGIVTLDDGAGRPEEYATNLKLWAELVDASEAAAIERAATRETKGTAKGSNGKPRKLTPAQQKKADAEAREKAKEKAVQFRRRLWAWYVDWLRWLVARELRQVTGLNEIVLVLVLRGAEWYDHRVDGKLILNAAGRAIKSPIRGKNTAKDLVRKIGDDELFSLAREFAARMFHDSDGPRPLVPDTDVGEIAGLLGIDVEALWLREQAGPVYSEAYWRLHTIDQLSKLAKELKVGRVDGGKKADYVETFLSRIPATDLKKPAGLALPKEIAKIKRPTGRAA